MTIKEPAKATTSTALYMQSIGRVKRDEPNPAVVIPDYQSIAKRELLDFLIEYRSWALDDAPPHPYLNRMHGLCPNLRTWGLTKGKALGLSSVILEEMLARHTMSKSSCPFGREVYAREKELGSHHKNKERLSFVVSAILELDTKCE